MAQVITRPGGEAVSPDLQAEYDRVDQWWTGQLQLIEQILRDMSQARLGSVHSDFNAMRYDAAKRLCLTMANDIHRDLQRSQMKLADGRRLDLALPAWMQLIKKLFS